MSKSKSDELERANSHIKRLQKEIARNKKRGERYPEPSKDAEPNEEVLTNNKKASCPKCNGSLFSIGGSKIKILMCDSCSFRQTKRGG